MTARGIAALSCVVVLAVACSRGDRNATRDSAAAADSVRAAQARLADSIGTAAAVNSGPVVDSTASPQAGLTGETRTSGDPATSTQRHSGRAARGKIIGRDSTAGPIGTMDSSGRVTRIKR